MRDDLPPEPIEHSCPTTGIHGPTVMAVKVRSVKQAMETPLQPPREVRRLDQQKPPGGHEGGMLLQQPWPVDESLQKAK